MSQAQGIFSYPSPINPRLQLELTMPQDHASARNLKQQTLRLDQLPALPVIAQQLLTLDLDSHTGERELLKLIAQDPFISAKLLGLANTPLFVMAQKVTHVHDAVMLLGLTRVKSVALGIAMLSALGRVASGGLDVNKLWVHSLAVAVGMRTLAKAVPRNRRPGDDEIFLIGLLHDLGYVVLDRLDPDSSRALHARMAEDPTPLITDVEQELIGTSHAELGALLGLHWGLPDEIVAVMRLHHSRALPERLPVRHLVELLQLAERILDPVGLVEGVGGEVCEAEWLGLEIDPQQGADLIAEVRLRAEEAAAAAQTLN